MFTILDLKVTLKKDVYDCVIVKQMLLFIFQIFNKITEFTAKNINDN